MTLGLTLLSGITRKLPRSGPTNALLLALLQHYAGKPAGVVQADVLGWKMQLDLSQFVDCALYLSPHLYDPDERAIMAERLGPGDVFLDLGAYVGLYALVASRYVGEQGIVLAVEPDPATYRRLKGHIDGNGVANVRCINLGVSDAEEVLRLGGSAPGFQAANSFLLPSEQGVAVACKPLIAIMEEQGITRVKGAKLDIEGFEYRVLARFLAEAPRQMFPEFMIVEFHPDWVPVMGGNVIDLLQHYGYRIQGKQALNYIMVQADAMSNPYCGSEAAGPWVDAPGPAGAGVSGGPAKRIVREMMPSTKTKHIALGGLEFKVTLPTERADAVRRSLPYRRVVRPLLSLLERRGAPPAAATANLAAAPVLAVPSAPAPAATPPADLSPADREIWDRMMAVEWYHTIGLRPGIITPGIFDHRDKVHWYRLPDSLAGKRCLDVATFDGFWAFEMERRGADEVIAIDLERWSQLDLPPAVKEDMARQGIDGYFGSGFNLAKEALGSQVQRVPLSVYDLSPERVGGVFDFAFCGDLLLHLVSPVKAIQSIRSVTAGEALFAEVFDPGLDESTGGVPAIRYMGGWHKCTWWMPSLSCLTQMIKDAGFSKVEVLNTFPFAERGEPAVWRAIIRATS